MNVNQSMKMNNMPIYPNNQYNYQSQRMMNQPYPQKFPTYNNYTQKQPFNKQNFKTQYKYQKRENNYVPKSTTENKSIADKLKAQKEKEKLEKLRQEKIKAEQDRLE